MPTTANTAGGIGSEGSPLGPEIQTAVRAELETMLMAPIFVQSARCKKFLSHIVEQALSGNAHQLKERTIGIIVFERANDYDTGEDSIVRVTANEVRKRIGQFYGEAPAAHRIQIELRRGSYVPEFRIQPLRRAEKSFEIATELESVANPTSTSKEACSISPFRPEAGRKLTGDVQAAAKNSGSKRMAYSAILVLLVAAAAVLGTWKERAGRGTPDLWRPFMHASVPILVCIDTHNLQSSKSDQAKNGHKFVDLVLRRQSISLDDAAILSSMASELGRRGIPFRVVGADDTSLADLRRQPVILIGAIDNRWALLLTKGLRYRIEVADAPGSGSSVEPIASIVDAREPTIHKWTTDLSVPYAAWKKDYALVARINDPVTGVPVLIVAGLGNDGSVAASELITSGRMTTILANEPSCKSKTNFEAVIGTDIIGTESGPPHMLRLTCW
jgi:hypothetical protein